jgi:CubicO group peptidase (beta-lactamase class C family)
MELGFSRGLGIVLCAMVVGCGGDAETRPAPYCGNGSCDWGENVLTCPADCGKCGTSVCDPGEDVASCPSDCTCGNGSCDPGESYASCPQDGCTCGDGSCEATESLESCPEDCGTCGNGSCEQTEDGQSCPQDCARYQPLIDAVTAESHHWASQYVPVHGLVVGVVEGGEVTFARGFGVRQPGHSEPVTPTTLFRIGSNTKKLTAVALLQLVADGLVSLDEPVTTYAPAFHFDLDASWAPSIQTGQLLTHESAMKDDYSSCDANSLAGYLAQVYPATGYLQAPPGAMYNYTNPGFSLAGLVLENASGQPYVDYVSQHVLAPLGMSRTFFDPADVLADGDFAWPSESAPDLSCYVADNGGEPYGGTLFSSVFDQARFMRFLRDGNADVLDDAWRTTMQQPQVSTRLVLDDYSYGYGLFVSDGFFLGAGFSHKQGDAYYGVRSIEHAGFVIEPTYSTGFYFFPELDFGFVWLASGDCCTYTSFWSSLAVALQTLAPLPEPTTPPDLTMGPEAFGAYEGEYFDPFFMGSIQVTKVGHELHVSLPDADQAGITYDPVLVPGMPDNFTFTWSGYADTLTFIFDGPSQATYVRSRSFVGTRVSGFGAQAVRPGVAPSQAANRHEARSGRARPLFGPAELARRLREQPLDVVPLP